MHYVAGERKNRHAENIDKVREKFAEMKREIIREKMEEKSQHILTNRKKKNDFLLETR